VKQNLVTANPSSSCVAMQKSSSLTAIPELSLDLDGLQEIICHPNNFKFLQEKLEEFSPKISDYIAFSHAIKIIADEHVPEFTDKIQTKNGKPVWSRTAILPDTQFVEWVDLENPSSWHIYFGLVEHAKERCFYKVMMGQTWSWDTKTITHKERKPRRISYSEQKRLIGGT
jgi:hypothetical protein